MNQSGYPRALIVLLLPLLSFCSFASKADDTRLLRQPSISKNHITFVYGADVWVADINGRNVLRLTSTPAVETEPHLSPDGKHIAFSSNRTGSYAVYVIPTEGGQPQRLTWHADNAMVRGWSPDGESVLYASGRDTAPRPINRLWTVPVSGGPATLVNKQWAHNGAFSADGEKMVIDRMQRWDVEWRHYRGGQNTPLVILDLDTNLETFIPNERTTDIEPVWVGDRIFFISDRDWIANIWAYDPKKGELEQITFYEQNDVKQLSSNGELLAFEHNGYLHTLDPKTKRSTRLAIEVKGDFPLADTQWTDVSESATAATLSPTGKRALFQARGDVFTVPVENGDVRNLSESSGAADRKPIWSPKGDVIAWFSDMGGEGYKLVLQQQDGLSPPRTLSIGESKMAWEPTFSPDGSYIAFVDDDVRIRVINLQSGELQTVDTGGSNLERGYNGITWSTDSNWLAYSKAASNSFRQIWVWSNETKQKTALTNRFADAFAPAWDRNGQHLYFLASTDYGLNSGWANTSSMGAEAEYAAYVVNLQQDAASPFAPKSDEEPVESEDDASDAESDEAKQEEEAESDNGVVIDLQNIERRTLALSVPAANYAYTISGPEGTLFIAERAPEGPVVSLHKFTLEEGKATPFVAGITSASISHDGKHLLVKSGKSWKVLDTGKPKADDGKTLNVALQMKLDRAQEWQQMFHEAWRYQRDYFYDPDMHGRDWDQVLERYAPLVPYIKHRADLSYVLDMVNGELSVGHSFVFGGDFPEVAKSKAGLLGADLSTADGYWKIERIYTSESWNPGLKGPLDQPGMDVSAGDFIVAVNGKDVTASDNIYQWLDGTADVQTVLHINSEPNRDGARQVVVKPIASERNLRQRNWIEDNRRKVDELSDGKLAYVWVPNTSNAGFTSFTRYFFAQQDKLGAVIDERFNGGGFLDDYMVDLMSRELRAAITNEVPDGKPIQLPAGLKGPKALLVNELAGSGGDFFPWVFRQQQIGPLIGARTWGGLVKSSVHYRLVDGGALTAPDNAVFDPINNRWIGENVGIAPDIDVYQDARALNSDRDPQLERGVQEVLKMLNERQLVEVVPPAYPAPTKR
ncbi:S41 family peptidase [Aestuariibacter salexigens]|uniref:S41 family peptidase n=1 Tax=Aestuariibacter salexigens TaxID=226010 RepID=UPI00040894DB|nr:S41 family peptidase [Aestuariibacter salexigens]